jgi:hypothetical protein
MKSNYNQIIYDYVKNVSLQHSAPLHKYADLYQVNSILFALMNYKAEKASQAKPMLYKVKDQEAAKDFHKFNGFAKDTYETKLLKKAKDKGVDEIYLDDITVTSPYYRTKRLLTKPNEMQSFGEFIYSLSAFYDISGFNLINTQKVDGQVAALYSLPTHQITIEGGSPQDPVKAYQYDGLFTQKFDPKDCHALRSFSTNYNKMGSHLYGTSKVQVCYADLQTYIAALEREHSAFKTGDSAHLLFPKNADAQIEASNDNTLLQKMRDGIRSALWKKDEHRAALVAQELGHINLANPIGESITLEVKKDIREILAAVFMLPPEVVFNESASSTYNNGKENGRRALHLGVFPFLNKQEEILSEEIIRPQTGLKFCFDKTIYDELALDKVAEMAKMKDIDFLTRKEKRQWFDYGDVSEGDSFEDAIEPVTPLNFDYGNS